MNAVAPKAFNSVDDLVVIGTAAKPMALEIENETYRRELPKLLEHENKFVLICGDQVVDTFDSYENAIKDGYRRFGLSAFMVKKIQASEQVRLITRLITPCLI